MSHEPGPVDRPATGTAGSSIAPRLDGPVASDTAGACRSVMGTYAECPLCGGELFPEHAHFKCGGCGWRDSCCD